tara:strand:+ start:1293 stop:1400 length:108 start_codon:yes stop_codon:yes gene_type:complete
MTIATTKKDKMTPAMPDLIIFDKSGALIVSTGSHL